MKYRADNDDDHNMESHDDQTLTLTMAATTYVISYVCKHSYLNVLIWIFKTIFHTTIWGAM